ncbi:MAG: hypothetical protein IPP15_16565 [Saprospiraceae bacterium]|uniref:Uncharacterized protein n=1 Tax=Candidatus Opimibacter skivensis TaxID=2982028 RepID=A0A9D7XTP8_9BACT|nr:hypothetical protein [Candidatus Opimibacter skivensis]
MPIEVREIVIKATVAGASGEGTTSSSQRGPSADDLIKTCVEKVLEILKEKKER